MSTSTARNLRLAQTEAEKRLWYRLRNRQIEGCKFRRQAPIGRYIVDFACFERNLIIELDGGQHASAAPYDRTRTGWLAWEEFTVLRFWNNEVIENMEGVLLQISQALHRQASVACTPHPGPLPQGERES